MAVTDWDVLGFGTAAVDELLAVGSFPVPDRKSTLLSVERQGGGQTATALVAAARQGVRTAFCCQLGMDELSLFSLAELEKEGVDCSPCIRLSHGRPYHSFIIVDRSKNTRTILHQIGNIIPPLDAITPELLGRTRLLILDDNMQQAAVHVARLAQVAGVPVVADLDLDGLPVTADLLPLVDHLIVGSAFARHVSGEEQEPKMAAALGSRERACCVVTAGSRGCWYTCHGSPVHHVPAFSVNVLDTTGCGDVFHGAYAAALARGESVPHAIVLASATAALKAKQPGGRQGIPGLAEVETFLKGSNG